MLSILRPASWTRKGIRHVFSSPGGPLCQSSWRWYPEVETPGAAQHCYLPRRRRRQYSQSVTTTSPTGSWAMLLHSHAVQIVPCCTHCWDLVGAAVLDHVCIQLWLTTNDLLNHAREWVHFMQHSMQSFPFQTACVEGTVHVLLENSPKPLVACKEHGADTEPPSTPRSGSPKEPSEPVCPFHGLLEGEGSLRSHDPCFDDVEGSRQPSCQSTRDAPPKHLGQGAPIKMFAKAAGPPDTKE